MNWLWPMAPAKALHLRRRHVALIQDAQRLRDSLRKNAARRPS